MFMRLVGSTLTDDCLLFLISPLSICLVFPFEVQLYSEGKAKITGLLRTGNVPEYLLFSFKGL